MILRFFLFLKMILQSNFALAKQISVISPISEAKIPKYLMFVFEHNHKTFEFMKWLILFDLNETSIKNKERKLSVFR
jgi:hypothetical protein